MERILKDPRFGLEPFVVKAFDDGVSISKDDLVNIFNDRKFLEEESFYVIETDTHEITTEHGEDFREDAINLKNAFLDGNTILIKRLHDVLPKFHEIACKFHKDANTYMLVAPNGGDSFDWHKDDRHVAIKIVYGSKVILYRNEEDEEIPMELHQGDWCVMPMGVYHKAVNMGANIVLTVGMMESDNWKVNECISKEDLEEQFPNFH